MEKEEIMGRLEMTSTFSRMRKINPVAFVLLFILMNCINTFLFSNESLANKLIFLMMSGTIFMVALFLEVHRIIKEEELKEEAWKKELE